MFLLVGCQAAAPKCCVRMWWFTFVFVLILESYGVMMNTNISTPITNSKFNYN